MDEVVESVEAFLRDSESQRVTFFNEAELQLELGYWLRTKLPAGMVVYLERPADWFFPQRRVRQKRD